MNKSEQLIACLEGEIAKRDEELAACRVAVENCEVFRARIAELEGDLRCAHSMLGEVSKAGMTLRAELSALKEQEPVTNDESGLEAWAAGKFGVGGAFRGELCGNTDWALARLVWSAALAYAAPVSEAKAQGVVMPERKQYHDYLSLYDKGEAIGHNNALSEVARINAAPVQQVSVPDGFRVMKPTSAVLRDGDRWEIYAPCGSGGIVNEDDVTDWVVRKLLDAMAAAPTAPAADAGKLADAFLSWKLPESVRPDGCAMDPTYPHRYGTNLMTWAQAKEMFEHVLAATAVRKGEQ